MGSKVSLNALGITSQTEEEFQPPNEEEGNSHRNRKLKQTQIEFPSYIITNHDRVQFKKEEQIQGFREEILYKVTLQNFMTIFIEKIRESERNKIWKVLNEGQNEQVCEGDLLKIGKGFEMKLKHLVIDISSSKWLIGIEENSLMGRGSEMNEKESQSYNASGTWRCRICFEEEIDDLRNPLVSLCRCEGSVKFTHFRCLKIWIKNKVKETNLINYTQYEYTPLKCDICKQRMETHFYHQQNLYSLIEDEPIKPPYAIFESRAQNENTIKCLIVKLQEGISIPMGRSTESGIQIRSQTVSRNHCVFYYTRKQLFIKDLNSKHGTYLYSPNAIYDFLAEKGIFLKINSTIFNIKGWQQMGLSMPNCCAASMKIKLRIIEDKEDKFTVETSGNIFDFLD